MFIANLFTRWTHTGFLGLQAAEERIQPVDKEGTKTFRLYAHHPRTVNLEKYNNLTPLFDAALISHDHRAYVFASRKGVLHPRNMVWSAASVTQAYWSGMIR